MTASLVFRFSFGNFSVRRFVQRIKTLGVDIFPEFWGNEKHTFFMPIDSAFKVSEYYVDH